MVASADDIPDINEKSGPVLNSEKGDALDTYMDNDDINMDTHPGNQDNLTPVPYDRAST